MRDAQIMWLLINIIFILNVSTRVNVNGYDVNEVHACGQNEFWSERPYLCGFKCTPNGIDIKCDDTRKHPGCDCLFSFYLNMDTMKCEKIKCKNMNCIGRANEQLFECESSRRDRCECTERITMDCNHGCMCMNGYCRVNGTCVKRSCHHSVYS